jgi:hypothetical protein
MGRALEEEWLTATQNLRELRVGGGEASVKLGRSVFVMSSVDYDTPSFLRSSPLHAACTEEGRKRLGWTCSE